MVIHTLKNTKKFYMDQLLQYQLDTLVYNAREDWDFVIVVTGDRMVRTGKSVLAMQLGAYLADQLNTPFSADNIFFDTQEMINFAQDAPLNSVIIYDEGREGLAANKSSQKLQKDLLDYFSECGQLNHIFIVVLPDFFELKENMAVARSEYLVNVWRAEENKMRDIYKDGIKRPVVDFKRGYFEFYSRKKKSLLYDIARSKHQKNYQLVRANLKGRFTNNYPIDEEVYRKKKLDALARFQEKKEAEKQSKSDVVRNKVIFQLKDSGLSNRAISRDLENEWNFIISHVAIGQILKRENYQEKPTKAQDCQEIGDVKENGKPLISNLPKMGTTTQNEGAT